MGSAPKDWRRQHDSAHASARGRGAVHQPPERFRPFVPGTTFFGFFLRPTFPGSFGQGRVGRPKQFSLGETPRISPPGRQEAGRGDEPRVTHASIGRAWELKWVKLSRFAITHQKRWEKLPVRTAPPAAAKQLVSSRAQTSQRAEP